MSEEVRPIDATKLKERITEVLMRGRDAVMETYINEIVCHAIDEAPTLESGERWRKCAEDARKALYIVAQEAEDGICAVCDHYGWRMPNDCAENDYNCFRCKASCYCAECNNGSNFEWQFRQPPTNKMG